MTYLVKEVFTTLQGEGARTGRVAVFCRFTGCNLWSGQERHRATAICQFCDTDFVGTDGPGGGKFDEPDELAAHVAAHWPVTADPAARPYVVCTGGEPLLQLDEPLIEAFHRHGFEVAVETNGTLPVPDSIDWVCVSPKANAELVVSGGDEIKLVVPQAGMSPDRFENLAFAHWYVQPMDGPDLAANTEAAISWCLQHPRWRLSVQTHKVIGIP